MEKAGCLGCANGLAAGQKWIIESQWIGLSEPNATLTTFELEEGGGDSLRPHTFHRHRMTLNTPISLLGFASGASANFTSPFFLDHTSNDVSEN